MKKGRVITGLIINLLVVSAVAFGVISPLLGLIGPKQTNLVGFFSAFTTDSNLLLALVCFIGIFVDIAFLAGKKVCKFFAILKLIAVTGTTVTLLVTVGYLAPFAGPTPNWEIVYATDSYLWLHVVAPALGIVSFIVENTPKLKLRNMFWGWVTIAIYSGTMVPLIIFGYAKDLYGFLTFTADTWVKSAIICGSIAVGTLLASLLLIILHNIGAEAAELPVEEKAEEPKPEEDKPEEKKEPEETLVAEPTPVEESPAKPVSIPAASSVALPRKKPTKRTYHITKQPSGKWQVKLANSDKVIRLFDTQSEAIAFTKGLVESRGGSYRIHTVAGKIRR